MESTKKKNAPKAYLTALWLSLFLGALGADRFYLGKKRTGLLKLLTLGGFTIWLLVDAVRLGLGQVRDSHGQRLQGFKVNSVTVKLSFLLLILLLVTTGLFEAFGSHTSSTSSSNVHINPAAAIVVSLIGFGLILGWLLFLIFTVVDAYRRRDWLWAAINILSFSLGFGVLNLVYYHFVRNKSDDFII